MAWYTDLKAAVTAALPTNNDNEIDAADLRNLLNNNIITQIGSAETQGVAVPATVPPSFQRPVVYFASEIGVYSNFSGVEVTSSGVFMITNTGSGGSWELTQVLSLQVIIDAVNAGIRPYFPFNNGQDHASYAGVTDIFITFRPVFDLLANREQLRLKTLWNNNASGYRGFQIIKENGVVVSEFFSNSYTPPANGYDFITIAEKSNSGIYVEAWVDWNAVPSGTVYTTMNLELDQQTYEYLDVIDADKKPYPWSQDDDNGIISSNFRAIKDHHVNIEYEAQQFTSAGIREFEVYRILKNKLIGADTYTQIYIREISTGTTVARFQTTTPTSGFEKITCPEYQSSGISVDVWVNWDDIPDSTDTGNTEKHLLQHSFLVQENPGKPVSHNFIPLPDEFPQFKGVGVMPRGFVPYAIRGTNPDLTLESILDAITVCLFENVPEGVRIAPSYISHASPTNGTRLEFVYLDVKSPNPIWKDFVKIHDIDVPSLVVTNDRYASERSTDKEMAHTVYEGIVLYWSIDFKSLPVGLDANLIQNAANDGDLIHQTLSPWNVKRAVFPVYDPINYSNNFE